MMSKELSEFYYQRALHTANRADLTNAVREAALSIGLLEAAYETVEKQSAEFLKEKQKRYKLAGLCYDRLGNYTMAALCFSVIPDYFSKCREDLEQKKERIDQIRLFVSERKYKQVIRLLDRVPGKSVMEYQFLGFCYGVLGRQKKASGCFLQAISLDIGSEDVNRIIKEQKSSTAAIQRKKGWWTKWTTMQG